jgi:predicted transcriptional regulator
MARPDLTRLELRILEVFWSRGQVSIREIQQAFDLPADFRTS